MYLLVQLNAGKHFKYELPADNNSFLYLFEGDGQLGELNVPVNTLIALAKDDTMPVFLAGKQAARFIMISGKPINESVVQYGPFVMNTREEVDQAMRDFQSNNFVRDREWIKKN